MPTGNCAGAITDARHEIRAHHGKAPRERGGRQQHALIVAEREPQAMRHHQPDEADGARRGHRGRRRE